MSADLWAAFATDEDATSNPWSQPSPADHKTSSQRFGASLSKAPTNDLVDVDRERSPGVQEPPPIQSPWGAETNFSPTQRFATTGPIDHRSSSGFEEEEEEIGWTDFSAPQEPVDPWAASKSLPGTEILWDAENVDADEDFGDFENGTADVSSSVSNLKINDDSRKPAGSQRSLDSGRMSTSMLLAESTLFRGSSTMQQMSQPLSDPRALLSSSGTLNNSGKRIMATSSDSQQKTSIIDDLPSEVEDTWDEWSPDPLRSTQFASQSILKATKTQSGIPEPRNDHRTPQVVSQATSRSSSQPYLPPSASTLPPTNIPPPSILISLLSTLISTLPTQVEKAMKDFTTSAESQNTADKALSTAVRKCLAALRVAARIVAGRKLRWKRDTHLSQSMRIGPAAAMGAGKSGMKLSGLDRYEIKREDREVAEFIRVWQSKLGSVRRALANVNAKIGDGAAPTSGSASAVNSGPALSSKKLEIPSIAENMAIRTLKGGGQDGGIRSAKACTLCGIKREERVDKVDGADVFDISNEWWVEHWGHAECRAFWYQHEKYLQQR